MCADLIIFKTHFRNMAMDGFRQVEKDIKCYVKCVSSKSKENLSKKQSKELDVQFDECKFDWEKVIDVRTFPTDDYRVHKAEILCSIDMPFLSPDKIIYNLSEAASGLYIISNALSPKAQLEWAKRAVEDFSKSDHTNITNLNNLMYANSDSVVTDNTESYIEDVADLQINNAEGTTSSLWEISCVEAVPFQSFSKLRWSCLGYHYGTNRVLLICY